MKYITNAKGVCMIITPKTTVQHLVNHLGSLEAVYSLNIKIG